jgi:hypothetical protein
MKHQKDAQRAAILAAAEHLETHPQTFAHEIYIPVERTDRGDALAWIGFYLGYTAARPPMGLTTGIVATELGMPSTAQFYARMEAIDKDWKQDASHCAAALKAYADLYYGNAS